MLNFLLKTRQKYNCAVYARMAKVRKTRTLTLRSNSRNTRSQHGIKDYTCSTRAYSVSLCYKSWCYLHPKPSVCYGHCLLF